MPLDSVVSHIGGTGTYAAYVEGPVRASGQDICDPDRDGDGAGCDR
ncbi:hypothetical protein [Gemmobacter sp. 24YEA27]|nr:hypothetical protein [Gemmobacter sp. 24YEA27]